MVSVAVVLVTVVSVEVVTDGYICRSKIFNNTTCAYLYMSVCVYLYMHVDCCSGRIVRLGNSMQNIFICARLRAQATLSASAIYIERSLAMPVSHFLKTECRFIDTVSLWD